MPAEEIEVPTLYDRAFHLATLAHCRQFDKAGRPYIEHPMQVSAYAVEMLPLFEHWRGVVLDPTYAATLGLLHDTVEDCDWVTKEVLRDLFPGHMAQDVQTLTFNTSTPPGGYRYRLARDSYLRGIVSAKSPYPLLVKAADLRHNTDPLRLQAVRLIDACRADRLVKGYVEDIEVLGLRDRDCPLAHFYERVPTK